MIIDRVNPDRMWVAALGELYSDNLGGALYRTTDGGAQWEAVLTVPGVGFVDMVADETDPDHLFAASWDRTRRAHDFTEDGTGSGIWESTDGGDSWARISEDNDFPEGPDAGRIGLSYHSATGTLFALIDNQATREDQPKAEDEGLTAMDFVEMDKATFEASTTGTCKRFWTGKGLRKPTAPRP